MKQHSRIATKFLLYYLLAAGSFIKRETPSSLEFIAALTTLCFLSSAITELLFVFLLMNMGRRDKVINCNDIHF